MYRVLFWSNEIVIEWEYLVNVLNAMELYTLKELWVRESLPPASQFWHANLSNHQLENWPLRNPGTYDKGRYKLSFLTLSAS